MEEKREDRLSLQFRKSARLKEYDYSADGYYFATICTYEHKTVFGEIKDGEMILNEYGKIAKNAWKELPTHNPFIELGQFIIMPNHVHGIIVISPNVGAGRARPSLKNNLSNVVGAFKSTVSKQINRLNNIQFRWQLSFYDHIIRSEKALDNIREYIVNNPMKWDKDEYNYDIL